MNFFSKHASRGHLTMYLSNLFKYLTILLEHSFVFPHTEHKPNLLQVKLILLGVTLVGAEKSYHSSFNNNIYMFEDN